MTPFPTCDSRQSCRACSRKYSYHQNPARKRNHARFWSHRVASIEDNCIVSPLWILSPIVAPRVTDSELCRLSQCLRRSERTKWQRAARAPPHRRTRPRKESGCPRTTAPIEILPESTSNYSPHFSPFRPYPSHPLSPPPSLLRSSVAHSCNLFLLSTQLSRLPLAHPWWLIRSRQDHRTLIAPSIAPSPGARLTNCSTICQYRRGLSLLCGMGDFSGTRLS